MGEEEKPEFRSCSLMRALCHMSSESTVQGVIIYIRFSRHIIRGGYIASHILGFNEEVHTVRPRSSDPFHIVNYYIKCVTIFLGHIVKRVQGVRKFG